MNNSELVRLMHAALDGEATPAEALELDRQLAADPAARTRFEDLKQLFEALRRVPKMFPPEGLVAAVTTAIPRRPAGRRTQSIAVRLRQP
jgi:anti-sigma factor RsiW